MLLRTTTPTEKKRGSQRAVPERRTLFLCSPGLPLRPVLSPNPPLPPMHLQSTLHSCRSMATWAKMKSRGGSALRQRGRQGESPSLGNGYQAQEQAVSTFAGPHMMKFLEE